MRRLLRGTMWLLVFLGLVFAPFMGLASEKIKVFFDETRPVGKRGHYLYGIKEREWYGAYKFAALLRQEGYTVEVLKKWPITSFDLAIKGVNILVITGPLYGFREEEISAIREFVLNGGSLYLSVIQWRGNQQTKWGSNPIARAFGAAFKENGVVCDPNDNYKGREYIPKIQDLADHPITQGVAAFYYQGTYIATVPEGAEVIAWTDADAWFDKIKQGKYWGNGRKDSDEETGPFPLIIAFEYGAGRVVISGDSSFITNDWIKTLDAKTLALNIIRWLAEPFGLFSTAENRE